MPVSKRCYSYSKRRIALFIVMMAAIGVTVASSTFGQATGAGPAGPAAPHKEGAKLLQLILGHVDFVFITIGVLSIWGLTLIIQASMKNRASVFMPEETTNQIREMISQRKFKELIEFTETD